MESIQAWAVYFETNTSMIMVKGIKAVRLTKEGAEAALKEIQDDMEAYLERGRNYWRSLGKSEKLAQSRVKAPTHTTYTIGEYSIVE